MYYSFSRRRADTDTPPSSPPEPAFGFGEEDESSPSPTSVMKPTVPDSQEHGDRRDHGYVGVEGHDPSKRSFPDAGDPASRESTFAIAQSGVFVEDSEEAVPLLDPKIGEARAGGRGDEIRNGFAPPKSFSSAVGQAETREEVSRGGKEFSRAGGGAVVFDRDGEISGRGGDSGNGVEGSKRSNGFVENAIQGVNDSTTGNNGGSNNSSMSSSTNNFTMSSLTEESAESPSAELMRRQMESLLARVEFLERRQQGLDSNAAARAAAAAGAAAAVAAASYAAQATVPGFPEGVYGDGIGGWGSSSCSRRKGSEFVSGEAVDYCRGQGTAMFTPPPRRTRGVAGGKEGNGDASTMMGVSTTPFTGLDVLFRTPNVSEGALQLCRYEKSSTS